MARVDFGLGVLEREMVAASVYPDPDDDDDRPGSGWLYRDRMSISQNGVGAPIVFDTRFDLRAQRKVGFSKIRLIINNKAAIGTTFSVEVRGMVRMLMLL